MALTATAGRDSKQGLIIGIVIAIHLGAYYVIESGLSQAIIEMVAPPVETKIIEEDTQEEEPPPPPPPPDMAPPPPFIPPPEVTVQVQASTNAIVAVTNERPPPAPPPVAAPPAPPPVALTKAGFDPRRPVRSNADFYPSASIRAEEEGVATVDIFIDAEGRVTDARIKQSSGFERLDEATLKYVKTWRMKPATRGGVAEGSWVTIPVRWKLETR
jgi:protein TonB